jgi:hypothetical protein
MLLHPGNSSLLSKDLPPISRHILLLDMRTSNGMLLDMNDPPPPGYHGQLPPHHPQDQAEEYWSKMQIKHLEGKDEHGRRQPPPSSSISTTTLTSRGGDLGPDDNLFLSRSNADEEQSTTSST